MRRREFITLLGGAAAASTVSWPLAASAQQPARVARIGYLVTGSLERIIDAFRQGLSQLGYREGQNIAIEFREAHGQPARFAPLAAELAGCRCDHCAEH